MSRSSGEERDERSAERDRLALGRDLQATDRDSAARARDASSADRDLIARRREQAIKDSLWAQKLREQALEMSMAKLLSPLVANRKSPPFAEVQLVLSRVPPFARACFIR